MAKPMITFTFDVESIGLHGEGFAVGYCVHQNGREVEFGVIGSPRHSAVGEQKNRDWVDKNIPAIQAHADADNPRHMRELFWECWQRWAEKDAIMVSDCGWPVEARFLNACIDDHPNEYEWQGPYPLFDLSSILFAHGCDPKGKYERRLDELPVHDPLADARQTARIFWELNSGILPTLAVENASAAMT